MSKNTSHMVTREQAHPTSIHTHAPILILSLHLRDFGILGKAQLVIDIFRREVTPLGKTAHPQALV